MRSNEKPPAWPGPGGFQLFHHRWSVPILAELHRLGGAKFVTLAKRLGVSRSVLTTTLERLVAAGLVARNPGQGHPLRPEYLLTEAGRRLGPFCVDVVEGARVGQQDELLRSKWALPIQFTIRRQGRRFSEIERDLAGITPRALSQELKQLRESGLVRRTLIDGFPPITLYELTPKGRPLADLFEKHRGRVAPHCT